MKNLRNNEMKLIEKSPAVRKKIAEKSFMFFFEMYFGHYMGAPFWDFHKEIIKYLEKEDERFMAVMAFRGSGKSSVVSMWFVLWSIIWLPQKKFIVIAAQTQQQAKQCMKNLKEELEANCFLKKDLWPFEEDGNEWNSTSLVLKQFWARITVISVDQSTRWIRHKNHRPDLIICDDIENLQSMKTKEWRDNLQEWFTKELIPLWDPKKTRIIVLWNMLHRDSLLMRIKDSIDTRKRSWRFFRFPILDENWNSTWPERFSKEDIENLKMSIWNDIAWGTEYMLQDTGHIWQIVKPEWICWEEVLPVRRERYYPRKIVTGVDLAISQSTSADYTAFVSWVIYGYNKTKKIYIVDSLEEKMEFTKTVDKMLIYDRVQIEELWISKHEFLVETVWYQQAMEQYMKNRSNLTIQWYRPSCSKSERLTLVSDLIKKWVVVFIRNPRTERLVEQILDFEKEAHDDLVDAFTMMVLKVIGERDREVVI